MINYAGKNPLNNTNSEQGVFLEKLAARLVEENYSIVSGYGLGGGSQIITGALNTIYAQKKISSDYLKLHPFPQNIADASERQRVWTRYRSDMCEEAGFQIIVFGSKKDPNDCTKTINSAGVKEEFELAHEKGLFVIPVSATGFMAQEVWRTINADLPKYGKVKHTSYCKS